MFTGLVQHRATVIAVAAAPAGRTMIIDASGWSHRAALGESVAVNGCCLTVSAEPVDGRLHFDVVHQTIAVTTLGALTAGSMVNLEHSCTPATLLGGHLVQGHIDCVGLVVAVSEGNGEQRLRIGPSDHAMGPRFRSLIVDKGSIAVDGVSLTVARADQDWFEVALIPTTLELTTLGVLKAGDRVNIEFDHIVKIVVNWLSRGRPPMAALPKEDVGRQDRPTSPER